MTRRNEQVAHDAQPQVAAPEVSPERALHKLAVRNVVEWLKDAPAPARTRRLARSRNSSESPTT